MNDLVDVLRSKPARRGARKVTWLAILAGLIVASLAIKEAAEALSAWPVWLH